MTTRLGRAPLLAIALLCLTAVTACGSDTEEDGVASLADATPAAGASAAASATGDLEQELLDNTSCLRDQGIDVPDFEVDAGGDVVLGGAPAGQALPDPEDFEAAQEVCGDPPSGLTSQFEQFDTPEFQDALLEFTQCLRDKGYDVADIDISDGGPGQGVPATNPLGDLDLSDPQVSADMDECQAAAFEGVDLPALGGGD